MLKKIGSLLVVVLGGLLLVYSASRSMDFIRLTLPEERQMLAWFGLAALDGGLLAWILAFRYGSGGSWQRGIALLMIVVDFVGAVLMFTLDTLYNTGVNGMTQVMGEGEVTAAVLALSGVIGLNIAATVAHHLTDPGAMKAQAEEDVFGKIQDAALARIAAQSDRLAAELAPVISGEFLANTRARYLAPTPALPTPGPGDLGETLAIKTSQRNVSTKGGEETGSRRTLSGGDESELETGEFRVVRDGNGKVVDVKQVTQSPFVSGSGNGHGNGSTGK